jgi:hypothetical protein
MWAPRAPRCLLGLQDVVRKRIVEGAVAGLDNLRQTFTIPRHRDLIEWAARSGPIPLDNDEGLRAYFARYLVPGIVRLAAS